MSIGKLDLLIDGLGTNALIAGLLADLLEVIEAWSGTKATVVTHQLPVKRWHDDLADGNPTVADAIMDRLVSDVRRSGLVEESLLPKLRPQADAG